MRSLPDWPTLGAELMSNFDHEVNQAVAQHLRDEQVIAWYPAQNFWADCWFDDDQFHAAVRVFYENRGTVSATTPQELMTAVSDQYGWD